MKALLLAGILALVVLAAGPSLAEEQSAPRSTPILERGPDRLTERQTVTIQHLAAFELGVGDQVRGEDLEGHLSIQLDVTRSVDDAHAASADLVEDLSSGRGCGRA